MILIQKLDSKKMIFFLQLILFILELTVFINYINKEIIPYYPFRFDQAAYLLESYQCYTRVLQEGFSELFKIHGANSLLFIPQAVLFFLIFGANRLGALLINFSYFLLLQLFLFQTVKSVTNRYSISFLFLGLLLSVNSPYFGAGGLLDFRIDFLAFCLYGISICCVIRSNLFVDKKWTFISIFFVSLLVLTRLIAFTYIFAIFSAMLFYFILKIYVLKNTDLIKFRCRLKNLLIAFSILIFLFLGVLYFQWNEIYNYYVIGHFVGNEKAIRAKEFGVTNIYEHLIYYPHSLIKDHISSFALNLVYALIFLVIVNFINYKLAKNKIFDSIKKNKLYDFQELCIFLAASILFPVIILTLDQSKSPVVIGILVTPCLFLLLFFLLYIFDKFPSKIINNKSIVFLSIIVFSFGLYHFNRFFLYNGQIVPLQNAAELSKMYDDIGNFFSKNNSKIIYSADRITDYFFFPSLSASYYERRHILLNIEPTRLGGTIFPISKEEAIANLKRSNLFIVNMDNYNRYSPYPFDLDVEKFRSDLQNIAQNEFSILNDYNINGFKYRVYVRQEINV